MRRAATALGFTATTLEVRGSEELEATVTLAYQEFIAPGNFEFRSRNNGSRLGNVVTFNWEMVASDGSVAGVGLDILVLDDRGQIRFDYQLIEIRDESIA